MLFICNGFLLPNNPQSFRVNCAGFTVIRTQIIACFIEANNAMNRHPFALSRPSSGKRRLKDLLVHSNNRVCADCGAANPKWA
ncbi:hypothetical protein ACS0TY_008634 [Phlomoides rotata]